MYTESIPVGEFFSMIPGAGFTWKEPYPHHQQQLYSLGKTLIGRSSCHVSTFSSFFNVQASDHLFLRIFPEAQPKPLSLLRAGILQSVMQLILSFTYGFLFSQAGLHSLTAFSNLTLLCTLLILGYG